VKRESAGRPEGTQDTRSQQSVSTSTRAALAAIAAVLAIWSWQFLTVRYNYGGNWTALFCIRVTMPVPAFLKSENLYLFQNSEGYDGQVYHLIAHDPWMRKGSADAIVDVSFRYQRILVPALAWIFALGHDPWIHASYFFVILAFVFLGVYWTAQFAARMGRPPAWGLLFLLAPATIVSIDRMTVDIALATFAAGFAYYASESVSASASRTPGWKILAILACAALTRETAVLIIGGYAIYLVTRRRFLGALLAAATATPAAAWYLYLSSLKRSSAPDYVAWIPFAGFAERIIHPANYSLSPLKTAVAMTCDYLALAGIALVFVCAIMMAFRRRWDAPSAAIYALAIAGALIGSRSVWEEAYAFARVLTPLLLLVAFQFLRTKPGLAFALLALPDAPIALALWRQIDGVLRGIAGR
jgi:hypothetical protein